MPHVTDEQFALLATEGEPALPQDAAAHLLTCPECRREVDAFSEVAGALRQPVVLQQPSEAVWDRIAAELDLAQPAAQVDLGPDARPAVAPDDAGSPAPVTPLRRSGGNGRWPRRLAFAAAASFFLGAVSMAAINQLQDRPQTEILRSIGLDPLPGWSETGTATLETVGGELMLVVDLPEGDIDGYREVWLIDRNVERLVSLGTMTGDRASFPIPEGLDLDEYVIVDVSREHFDGDPTHSGDSIVRGTLS